MNITDARGRYEPEEGEATFLSMNLTKAAMREPARVALAILDQSSTKGGHAKDRRIWTGKANAAA